jgi:hypothetical protein
VRERRARENFSSKRATAFVLLQILPTLQSIKKLHASYSALVKKKNVIHPTIIFKLALYVCKAYAQSHLEISECSGRVCVWGGGEKKGRNERKERGGKL